MFLHPGIIALVIGSGIELLLVLYAALLGVKIIRRWDIKNSLEEQLVLERKTYLVSTLVQYALLFEIITIPLFIYTAEDIHTLLTGAMCATGSLNANPFGFPTLHAKTVSFFVSASWVAINHLDNSAADYPLIKTKYKLLAAAFIILTIEFVMQFEYFLKIDPDVITSCCGVMFSEKGKGIASSLSAIPALPAKLAFIFFLTVLIISGMLSYKTARKPFTLLFSITALLFFIVSIVSIISFISLYFYQIPAHHCPFDILQKEYYYVGYPLYASLFAGSFLGMIIGIIEPFKKIPSMTRIIISAQRRWTACALALLILFALISAAPVVLLPFKM